MRLCTVYRSPRHEEMYLYVDRREALERVPDELLERFGEPQEVLALVLKPDRALSRADTTAVLEAIAERGYYLQLPPPVPGEMAEIPRA